MCVLLYCVACVLNNVESWACPWLADELYPRGAEVELCMQDILNFVGTAVQAVLNGVLLIQCIRTAQRRQPPPTSTQTQAAFET